MSRPPPQAVQAPHGAALVLGATGLVGSALLDRLARTPQVSEVVALVRRPLVHASPKVRCVELDFSRLQDHADAFQGRWLFACLGTTLRQAGSAAARRQVDLELQHQATCLAAQGGVRHCLLVSSALARADHANDYLQLKGELEQRVLALPFERVSIFQPSLLQGPRAQARPGEAVAGALAQALCRLPGLGRYRPVPADQLAARMVEVSLQPGPRQQWFRWDQVFAQASPSPGT